MTTEVERIIQKHIKDIIYCEKCSDGSVGVEGGIFPEKIAKAIEHYIQENYTPKTPEPMYPSQEIIDDRNSTDNKVYGVV